jgi:hypothetical protein
METYTDYLRRRGELSDPDPRELAREIEKHWGKYEWEQGDLIDEDKDEREEYRIMTCEACGFTFEGTGTYSCGELIVIDNVEQK